MTSLIQKCQEHSISNVPMALRVGAQAGSLRAFNITISLSLLRKLDVSKNILKGEKTMGD